MISRTVSVNKRYQSVFCGRSFHEDWWTSPNTVPTHPYLIDVGISSSNHFGDSAQLPNHGPSGNCFPTIRKSSGRLADHPGIGDLILRCAVRDDLFVTPVLLDRKVSQCFFLMLDAGCRGRSVILRLQFCPCFNELRLASRALGIRSAFISTRKRVANRCSADLRPRVGMSARSA